MAISNNPWQPKPQIQAQPQQPANRAQSPDGQAKSMLRQLQSNPALLKSISDKFKAETKKEVNNASGVSMAPSSFTSAEGTETSQELGLSFGVKRQERADVAPQIRRASLGALRAVENLAPALGSAAGSPQISGEVGMAAGLKLAPKGGGVLGAVVAKDLSFGSKRDVEAGEVRRSASNLPGLKAPAIFGNQIHHATMLGPTPTPRQAGRSELTPEASGQRRLSDALHQAAGKIGEFLKDSNVGKMLRSVDGLPEALATKATERLKSERFFLKF